MPGFFYHKETPLGESDASSQFLLASNEDLLLIKKSGTGSGFTEIHRLSAQSDYQEFVLHTSTALHETDDSFEFLIAPNSDLLAIHKSNTGSNTTEIHRLSAQSNYQEFSLHTPTGLHETDDSFEFLIAPNNDLLAIHKSNTGSNTTEIHRLSAQSNYQEFSLHTPTGLHETDDSFQFLLAHNNDLLAIHKSNTGSHSTEIHRLSAQSNYQDFVLQTSTDLCETGKNFEFLLANKQTNKLFAVKKSATGSRTTELHGIAMPDCHPTMSPARNPRRKKKKHWNIRIDFPRAVLRF